MVTMTSESDKTSSSASKKAISSTVAPITEVAPNIIVYKKVRLFLTFSVSFIKTINDIQHTIMILIKLLNLKRIS